MLSLACAALGAVMGWGIKKTATTDVPRPTLVQTDADRISSLKLGPWGDLECISISIELPAGLIRPENYLGDTEWFFKGNSRAAVMELFKTAGVSADQLQAAARNSWWNQRTEGCYVRPDASFVINLPPEVRRSIYSELGRYHENKAYYTDFLMTRQQFDQLADDGGLPEETLTLFRKLIYTEGDLVIFNDASLVLSTLPDKEMQLRFLKSISRRSTYLMKLKINEQSDLDALVSYWGVGRRSKDLRPLLESLQRVPGGCTIDVAHLVPFFARKRIYTYPVPETNSFATRENCHWTALNFFNDPPQHSFLDPSRVEEELKKNYQKISGNPQMGDLVLFREARGEVVHSATYIAEDILFTKNGEGIYQPWIFMKAPDVKSLYANQHGSISATLYRRKDLSAKF